MNTLSLACHSMSSIVECVCVCVLFLFEKLLHVLHLIIFIESYCLLYPHIVMETLGMT